MTTTDNYMMDMKIEVIVVVNIRGGGPVVCDDIGRWRPLNQIPYLVLYQIRVY